MGESEVEEQSWRQRLDYAWGYVGEILHRVWPYVIGGIAVGAFIHGYAPQNLLLRVAGKGNNACWPNRPAP